MTVPDVCTFMQPDPSEIGEFLNQSCKHGVRNTYCVELWNGLFDPHGSFVSVRQDYTVSCIVYPSCEHSMHENS